MEIINFKQNYIKNKNFKYNDLTFNDIGRVKNRIKDRTKDKDFDRDVRTLVTLAVGVSD